MAKAAASEELRNSFTEHLEQTRGHVERLEQIFEALGERAGSKKCVGMEGLVAEGSEMMHGDFEGNVKDTALISATQRVEHYEIAAYDTPCAFDDLLDESRHRITTSRNAGSDTASLLRETLEEDKQTDTKLSEFSDEINVAANQYGSKGSDVRTGRKPGQAA